MSGTLPGLASPLYCSRRSFPLSRPGGAGRGETELLGVAGWQDAGCSVSAGAGCAKVKWTVNAGNECGCDLERASERDALGV